MVSRLIESDEMPIIGSPALVKLAEPGVKLGWLLSGSELIPPTPDPLILKREVITAVQSLLDHV